MTSRSLSRCILIVACGIPAGCGLWVIPLPATAATAESTQQNAEATTVESTDLSVSLELDQVDGVPTIDRDKLFRVVLTNNTVRAIRIWNPRTQAGYFQLSLHFTNPVSGEEHITRKRQIEDGAFWKSLAESIEPGTEQIEIAANESFTTEIDLSAFAWGELAWNSLPDPGSSDRFLVAVHFESPDGGREADRSVWTGESKSDTISVQFVASNLKTPHDYLWNRIPTAAIRLMTNDPRLIKAKDDNECTPLHHAARFGHVEAVRWLLHHGADVNAIAYNGFTPLHLTDHREIIELILQYEPDLTIHCRSSGETPLQAAAKEYVDSQDELPKHKWRAIVDTYLAAGADYDALSAICLADIERLKAILKDSPQLADDFEGESLLRPAAAQGNLEICRYIVEHFRVDVDDFRRGTGYPIIMGAVEFPEIVKLLIDHGADLKTRIIGQGGRSGMWIIGDDATILHYAAESGVPETVTLLIDSGVDIFATAQDTVDQDQRQTALEVAANFGMAANAEAILKHPTFVAGSPELRQALLDKCLLIGAHASSLARDAERPKLIQVLVEAGANPDAREDGVTPMLVAAREIHPTHETENAEIKRIIAYLIERGAKVDFFSAVAIGDLGQVRRLLDADPLLAGTSGPDGYPALQLAVGMDYREIVAAMLKAGCDVDTRNESERTGSRNGTALHCAAFWGRREIASMLIDAGADVNAVDENQTTPLDEAYLSDNELVAQLLLKHGAIPGVRDKQ